MEQSPQGVAHLKSVLTACSTKPVTVDAVFNTSQFMHLLDQPSMDLILAVPALSDGLALEQVIPLLSQKRWDAALIVVADAIGHEQLTALISQGIRDVVPATQALRLQFVIARELASLKERRALQYYKQRCRELESARDRAAVANNEAPAMLSVVGGKAFTGVNDLLTGLYKREYFIHELEQLMSGAELSFDCYAVLLIELDAFEKLRDELGIAIADVLLSDIAGVIGALVDDKSVFSRYDDHTYALLSNAEQAQQLAEAIRKAVEKHSLQAMDSGSGTTCSIGVSIADEGIKDAATLIANARLARDVSRAQGGNRVHLFHADLDAQVRREQASSWSERIRDALDNGAFQLVFQPILNLHARPNEYYEVLLRMIDETGCEVLPHRFMAAAGEAGLMPEIDRWVTMSAIRILVEQRRLGRRTHFFVKLSAHTLCDAQPFLGWISGQLRHQQLPGDALAFELSSAAARDNREQAEILFSGLKELHCGVALEHYGDEERSQGFARDWPIDYLKIDATLIHNLAQTPENQRRVKSIVNVARSEACFTIAGFVEDAQSLSALWSCGVDYIQGYYVQRPMARMGFDFSEEDS
ncbi:MAG: bifunctional diguanylate cyclase/phosphodiesterase [Gammaproteobacteria bacterium]|nr:bifunctional diguanylate cyclase/phosphodiesterase [Gammaproteobacteria bacterium]